LYSINKNDSFFLIYICPLTNHDSIYSNKCCGNIRQNETHV